MDWPLTEGLTWNTQIGLEAHEPLKIAKPNMYIGMWEFSLFLVRVQSVVRFSKKSMTQKVKKIT